MLVNPLQETGNKKENTGDETGYPIFSVSLLQLNYCRSVQVFEINSIFLDKKLHFTLFAKLQSIPLCFSLVCFFRARPRRCEVMVLAGNWKWRSEISNASQEVAPPTSKSDVSWMRVVCGFHLQKRTEEGEKNANVLWLFTFSCTLPQ